MKKRPGSAERFLVGLCGGAETCPGGNTFLLRPFGSPRSTRGSGPWDVVLMYRKRQCSVSPIFHIAPFFS